MNPALDNEIICRLLRQERINDDLFGIISVLRLSKDYFTPLYSLDLFPRAWLKNLADKAVLKLSAP